MSTSTLSPFVVQTRASKSDQRTVTVLAASKAAAAAAAISGHRDAAGLPKSASVLTTRIVALAGRTAPIAPDAA